MNNKEYIREDLMGFTPYQAGHVTEGIKLDANENPYGMEDLVREKVMDWLSNNENFAIYPDSNCTELRQA
ncbi:MAG: histidinol-phosphate transaminase, partial [Epulopiscium sp.]|nr:histidinol-phosphate transaminase [Candidatus Epulonipiscium sp.]